MWLCENLNNNANNANIIKSKCEKLKTIKFIDIVFVVWVYEITKNINGHTLACICVYMFVFKYIRLQWF